MRVVWSRRAIRHLVALREHLAKDPEESAARVAERILEAVALLEERQGIGRPGRVVGTREMLITGTPYLIPYRVRNERLELLGVFHGRQKWPSKF